MKTIPKSLFLAILLLALHGCAFLEKQATRASESLLDSEYEAFLSEEDPLLAKEASAGNLKLIDGLLLKDPDNKKLQVLSSQALFSYSFGYVEGSDDARAAHFYLRGLERASQSLGGKDVFLNLDIAEFQKKCEKEISISFENYFWSAINLAAWVNLNKSDLSALNNREKIEIVAQAVISQNETYYYGGGDMLLGLYYSIQSKALGGDPSKGAGYFEKCLKINHRKFLPALFFYAKYYAVTVQDKKLFESLLSEIKAFNLNSFPEQRLANTITQEKAALLLKKEEDYFL